MPQIYQKPIQIVKQTIHVGYRSIIKEDIVEKLKEKRLRGDPSRRWIQTEFKNILINAFTIEIRNKDKRQSKDRNQ